MAISHFNRARRPVERSLESIYGADRARYSSALDDNSILELCTGLYHGVL